MAGQIIQPAATTNTSLRIAEAVQALPMPRDDSGRRWTLEAATAAWLHSRRSHHTRTAYYRAIASWLVWCDHGRLDPRRALRADVDMWFDTLDGSKATRAQRLSAVSSWYAYLGDNQLADANPAAAVERPAIDRDSSPTVGLTGDEVGQLVRTARASTTPMALRDAALVALLAGLALRVGEALALDVDHVRHNRGHRTVQVRGKGGRVRELPVPPAIGRDLDAWLTARAELVDEQPGGALFVTRSGKRLDQPAVFRMLRRLAAECGLEAAERLSPHSLRHTAITAALDAGAPLRDVQDMAGHADPRTTRRYDRSRGNLDRSPAYLIAGLLADDEE